MRPADSDVIEAYIYCAERHPTHTALFCAMANGHPPPCRVLDPETGHLMCWPLPVVDETPETGAGTATSDDLAAFLLARLAEDEQVARDALAVSGAGDWELDSLGEIYSPSLDRRITSAKPPYTVHAMVAETPDECWHDVFSDERVARHCIRWDPDRVLAECEAKRRILDFVSAKLANDVTDETALYLLRCSALPYREHKS
jgi:hypothetical protein